MPEGNGEGRKVLKRIVGYVTPSTDMMMSTVKELQYVMGQVGAAAEVMIRKRNQQGLVATGSYRIQIEWIGEKEELDRRMRLDKLADLGLQQENVDEHRLDFLDKQPEVLQLLKAFGRWTVTRAKTGAEVQGSTIRDAIDALKLQDNPLPEGPNQEAGK